MTAIQIWDILTSPYISTGLVILAAALVFIAVKLWEKPDRRSRSSK